MTKDFTKCMTGHICGVDRLGIPSIRSNDGPQGFRPGRDPVAFPPGHVTQFPGAMTVAASFDVAIAELWGETIGKEFRGMGSNMCLGPGLSLARIPKNGRNFEYLAGEDPKLGAVLAPRVVSAIQAQRVIANGKHYVDNSQEDDRNAVTEVMDERTQWEIFYPAFQAAADAGLMSVMCSYNKIKLVAETPVDIPTGTHPPVIQEWADSSRWACENPESLQRDLKDRMGFGGFVVSDWGATHTTSLTAGLDVEMPGQSWMNAEMIKAAIASGEILESKVDDAVLRILTALFAIGEFDEPNTNTPMNNMASPEHHQIAADVAAAGTVLLQNRGDFLPIVPRSDGAPLNIAVIGHEALGITTGGGGSGAVPQNNLTTPLAGIRARAGIRCTGGDSAQCARCNADGSICVDFQDVTDPPDIDAAVALAARSSHALVFVATTSSEGSDRQNLSLGVGCPNSARCESEIHIDQDELISAVSSAPGVGAKTAVIAVTPGALLTPWRDRAAAVLVAFMPGQAYGLSIASILFGDQSPTGRLPVTFPAFEDQQIFPDDAYPGLDPATGEKMPSPCRSRRSRRSSGAVCPEHAVVINTEGLLVGYRWFLAHDTQPAFCFGHGVSYTTFTYSNLVITDDGAGSYTLRFVVTNTGATNGAEIAQLYLGFPHQYGSPPKELKGFVRSAVLAPGESDTLTIQTTPRDVSVWDVASHSFLMVDGRVSVSVGPSSCDTRLSDTMIV